MSDTNRQSLVDKAAAALKPDSQKSFGEDVGDKFKGTGDSAASTVQPESQKSFGQKVYDTVSGNQNENTESWTDKVQETVGLGGKNTGT